MTIESIGRLDGRREVCAAVPTAVVRTWRNACFDGSSFLELKPKLCIWLKLLVSLVLSSLCVRQDTSLTTTSRLPLARWKGSSPPPAARLVRLQRGLAVLGIDIERSFAFYMQLCLSGNDVHPFPDSGKSSISAFLL